MTDPRGPAEAKTRLRRQLVAARARRSRAAREHAAVAFDRHLTELLADRPRLDVAAYLPLATEPPLEPALVTAHHRGHRIWVPVCEPGRRLSWARWTPDTPERSGGAGGLREPVGARHGAEVMHAVGLLLVPALAVAPGGARLGFGGGYYDRFLATLPRTAHPELRTVVCVFADEVLPAGSVPVEELDAPVPLALTENGTVRLEGPPGPARGTR
ncbi:5-formyltetrahydrofolate cyclo-ligase [Kocuria sp. UCD-OTCP]|uniref:5-formyltetrahydrofolate cyclo-ligase n=1 Tax=Kocuria sp. UCD-OTCP TaxID=1292021 RepID=UPI00035ED114|nr:5-formyltetrahydrofolate cyclo-ligase [Kocuria sp. UCD-OTCP]EYT51549.1 5-formyltetrahydrofolate cyclo-ligase [Kocuria sp. UCD-OTCP]